jgi:hypothetical protein
VVGTDDQQTRRDRRTAAPRSKLPRAALATLGLLTIAIALIVPGAARASGVAMAAADPAGAGAPGGATMASATQLYTQLRNRGTLDGAARQFWYKLNSEHGEHALLEVWSPTRSCPVRAVLLDASGKTLGQIVSSPGEIVPFLVVFPAHPASDVYYLRIDADPHAPCASTSYSAILLQPEQADSCNGPPGPPLAPGETRVCATAAVPAYTVHACDTAGTAYRQDKAAAEEAARRHLDVRRRALEAQERADLRRIRANCPGVI